MLKYIIIADIGILLTWGWKYSTNESNIHYLLMLIKNLRIKALLLGLLSLNLGYTCAATTSETPTLGDAASYYYQEIKGNVDVEDLNVYKYYLDEESGLLVSTRYNIIFNDTVGDYGGSIYYYKWERSDVGYLYLDQYEPRDYIYLVIPDLTVSESNKSDGQVDTTADWVDGTAVDYSFIGHYTESDSYTYGGAIYSSNATVMGNITGDFVDNAALATLIAQGGAIYNNGEAEIGLINGSFIGNHAYTTLSVKSSSNVSSGGAIFNTDASIAGIAGDFIGNTAYAAAASAFGGAIFNGTDGVIGDITGDFINNQAIAYPTSYYLYYSANWAAGGAIFNNQDGVIGNITGDFIGNSASIAGGAGYNSGAKGGAIYNYGEIGDITGDFISNYTYVQINNGDTGSASGGAICNSTSAVIGDITGNFINNHILTNAGGVDVSAAGGAIYNWGTIDDITGDFIGNYICGGNGGEDIWMYGGAIYCSLGSITKSVTGSFIGNYLSCINESDVTSEYGIVGGAVYIKGRLRNEIVGDFIGNYIEVDHVVISSSYYYIGGGAIATDSSSGVTLTGNFYGNYISADNVESSKVLGGAIYNGECELTIYASSQDVVFCGNYIEVDGVKESNAIYNSAKGEITFSSSNGYSIVINDGVTGAGGSIYISTSEDSSVEFNNILSGNNVVVDSGNMVLGEYAGGEISLTGIDYNNDGVVDTMRVDASEALLDNVTLTINSGGTLSTKADYLGNNNVITNSGTINITSGTLSQEITGTGTINIFKDVTVAAGSMSVSASSTLNNHGVLHADLEVGSNADVNAMISADNIGQTIYDGSISGIDSMDVSFDLSADLFDLLGSVTTIYANADDNITLNLIDSDAVSGARVVDNTVVVDSSITVLMNELMATATKVDDVVSLTVTSGSLEIADGESQTISSITILDDASVNVIGGTLETDTSFVLGNDDATTGIIADSGVIESTGTVQLSEGTTTVASGKSLELVAELTLAANTQATLHATDANLILQKDVTLGANSVLTLDGNISGSANFWGDGTGTINYTGVYSPGNSPALVSYADISVNYETGTILVMEVFGEAGAGVDGGHDKISFSGCDVSFDGTIMLSIDDVDILVNGDASKVVTFDLFDFENGSSVLSEGDFILDYDSSNWLVTADTTNLYTTGEVSLSFAAKAVPEPSTASLSLLALTALLLRRRRRAAVA